MGEELEYNENYRDIRIQEVHSKIKDFVIIEFLEYFYIVFSVWML